MRNLTPDDISNLILDDLVTLYNMYASDNNCEQVCPMDDFNDLYSDTDPLDLIDNVMAGFSVNDDYFYENSLGHLYSIGRIFNFEEAISNVNSELAIYANEHMYNRDIENIFESYYIEDDEDN